MRGEGAFGPGLPTTMSFQLCHLPEREAKLWEGHVCRAERAWYAVRARLEEARGWEMPRNLLGWAWLVEALGCDPTLHRTQDAVGPGMVVSGQLSTTDDGGMVEGRK